MKTIKKLILTGMILAGIQMMASTPLLPLFYRIENNSLYWGQKQEPIKEIDFKTLTIITDDGKNIPLKDYNSDGKIHSHFIKDKNNVYYQGYKIEGADPNTFEILKGSYFKDKNNVYKLICSQTINGRKNKPGGNYCYSYSIKKMKEADPNTFEALEHGHFKDKNNVYFYEDKIKGADTKTFESLKYSYSKDKNNVYYQGKKMQGADPNTFKTNKDYGEAEDKNHKYYLGKVKK